MDRRDVAVSEESDALARAEQRLGHAFARKDLLETALSHPSFAHERDGSRGNERLEFLGDAVLGLAVAELLYAAHPEWHEGELTRARAALVNAGSLAGCARALDLGELVRLGRTEQRSGGAEKDRILANVFEAVLGAIHLDGGPAAGRAFVERVFGPALVDAPRPERDAKTRLQEWAHAALRVTPGYRTLEDSGVDEDAERFRVAVVVGDEVWAEGVGRTKRQAEQVAAERALTRAEVQPGPARTEMQP